MLTVNIVENHIEIQYQDYIDDNLEIQNIFQRNKIREQLTAKCSFITSISTIFDMILKHANKSHLLRTKKQNRTHFIDASIHRESLH